MDALWHHEIVLGKSCGSYVELVVGGVVEVRSENRGGGDSHAVVGY